MATNLTISVTEGAHSKSSGALGYESPPAPAKVPGTQAGTRGCFHCGTPCGREARFSGEKAFCCQGCLTVYELLTENGLDDFYAFGERAGVRIKAVAREDQFKFLDEKTVRARLVDFEDERTTRATFRIPAIHCIACVWLLENLFRLKLGVGQSQVNFPRKEVSVSFQNAKVKLSQVVALLGSLGYEPELRLSDLESRPASQAARRLWLRLGIAGFAFGNIMLFSLSSYFGLDSFSAPAFKRLFAWLSLALALPVVFYSASDYWRSAWIGLRQRSLTIEVPITLGIIALFGQSIYEITTGRGEGYFDTLAGLLFFLLCGKLFQQKTYGRLAFDRDYKSFFPLSITRKNGRIEERVSLSQLAIGDRLVVRNGELIPADARLLDGPALIDYSFVTGESEPVEKRADDYLYAGGRQIGGAIEIEMTKAVSQSYLTSLWNQSAFHKDKGQTLDTLTNRYSQRFTKMVIAIAVGAALFWMLVEPGRAVKAFTSVLIVACPCALALAAPFALGTAQRILGRRNVFLKNPHVVETLARVDTVVFDKTGTLTNAGAGSIVFHGTPLTELEERWLYSLTRHSTHPCAVRIGEAIAGDHVPDAVGSFGETPGAGVEGTVDGHEIRMGSRAWLESRSPATAGSQKAGVLPDPEISESRFAVRGHDASDTMPGSVVHLAIDGEYRGCHTVTSALRPEASSLIERLSDGYDLALLSGDNSKERTRFSALFGKADGLHFNQSPLYKLSFIRQRQDSGKTVMMVGDGLNDAGALRQSDVGVAVVENIGAFSPASDVIVTAGMVTRLHHVLRFSKASVRCVRLSFLLSSLYNLVGISIAARGLLSPVICAILMPLSSITVVAFACGLTSWAGRRAGLTEPARTGREGRP